MAMALDEITHRLVNAYHPEMVYLFGSQARGDAGPDSDYDVLVVMRDDTPDDKRDEALAYRALRGTGTAVDVIVMTKTYFEERLHVPASLPATVIREGRMLYGA